MSVHFLFVLKSGIKGRAQYETTLMMMVHFLGKSGRRETSKENAILGLTFAFMLCACLSVCSCTCSLRVFLPLSFPPTFRINALQERHRELLNSRDAEEKSKRKMLDEMFRLQDRCKKLTEELRRVGGKVPSE